jgi:hypothetical protein
MHEPLFGEKLNQLGDAGFKMQVTTISLFLHYTTFGKKYSNEE